MAKKMDRRKPLWILLLLLLPCLALSGRPALRVESWLQTAVQEGSPAAALESYVSGRIPFRLQLQELGLRIWLLGGQQEQDGIFIDRNRLTKNIGRGSQDYGQTNAAALLQYVEYAEDSGVPIYLALIPTASAIMQEDLPRFADTYNQRQFIDDIYTRMYGRVSAVDLYNPLFNARDQYIYYRTEHNLTALGGYHIYNVLGERMGLEDRSLGLYDVDYASHSYYGDLYQRSPYQNVRPDVLALYRYRGSLHRESYRREYVVTHVYNGQRWTYHTLYPEHLQDLGREMDVYLGGLSPVIHIDTSATESRTLLVFGDQTALAYLPFLCNHYARVTLVDLSQGAEVEEEIRPEEYSQILFAYGVDTFVEDGSPSRILEWMD